MDMNPDISIFQFNSIYKIRNTIIHLQHIIADRTSSYETIENQSGDKLENDIFASICQRFFCSCSDI